jgi:hypothetical protein
VRASPQRTGDLAGLYGAQRVDFDAWSVVGPQATAKSRLTASAGPQKRLDRRRTVAGMVMAEWW